tara:strand:- start:70 stop:831 length:762 start_codon:yes stop_codon:yes gene_type:complete
MKKRKSILEPKDRVYLLKNEKEPLAYFIASRDTPRNRLLYYDEENNINRPLRYARNANSPFQDEQDNNVILEPIVFEDGVLRVPKTNPVLQEFLHYHPNNGSEFYEFDNEKDAQDHVDFMYSELDAQVKARDLDWNTMEAVANVLIGGRVSSMTVAEVKRDIMLYAKRYPQDFMEAVNDPSLRVNNIAARALSDGYLSFRNNKKEIFYNLKENKKKLMTIPFGEDPLYTLASYLQSNDGLELFKFLDEKISEN